MATGPRETYLPTAGFDHEFPGQVRSWLWLQGADDNALVQGITRHNLKGKEFQMAQAEFPEDSGPEAGLFLFILFLNLLLIIIFLRWSFALVSQATVR